MIPATAHFIWFGDSLPCTHVLAIRSAAEHGDFERVVLHYADRLDQSPWWSDLNGIRNFDAQRLEPTKLFSRLNQGSAIRDLYQSLEVPEAKSDVCRVAILALEGGVYFDLDTITVRSLAPLRSDAEFFCGREWICWPASVLNSMNVWQKVESVLLEAMRYVCRQLPNGWKTFRNIEHLYHCEVNNAVLGAVPDHRLLHSMMTEMTTGRRRRHRAALGPHLLQKVLRNVEAPDARIHPPSVFSPLPPEISHHWFKYRRTPNVRDVLYEDTRVVHWYASVSTRGITARWTPSDIREHADQQLFSALASQFATEPDVAVVDANSHELLCSTESFSK